MIVVNTAGKQSWVAAEKGQGLIFFNIKLTDKVKSLFRPGDREIEGTHLSIIAEGKKNVMTSIIGINYRGPFVGDAPAPENRLKLHTAQSHFYFCEPLDTGEPLSDRKEAASQDGPFFTYKPVSDRKKAAILDEANRQLIKSELD